MDMITHLRALADLSTEDQASLPTGEKELVGLCRIWVEVLREWSEPAEHRWRRDRPQLKGLTKRKLDLHRKASPHIPPDIPRRLPWVWVLREQLRQPQRDSIDQLFAEWATYGAPMFPHPFTGRRPSHQEALEAKREIESLIQFAHNCKQGDLRFLLRLAPRVSIDRCWKLRGHALDVGQWEKAWKTAKTGSKRRTARQGIRFSLSQALYSLALVQEKDHCARSKDSLLPEEHREEVTSGLYRDLMGAMARAYSDLKIKK